jgi:hypothetical protein
MNDAFEPQELRERELRESIEAGLVELAEIIGPEDTLAYVEKVAEQMREEIAEGV